MSVDLVVAEQSTIDKVWNLIQMPSATVAAKEKFDRATALRGALLPVEEHAKNELDEKIKVLGRELKQQQFPEAMIPFEVLKWRWPDGMPKLIPMRLSDPSLTFWAQRSEFGSLDHGMSASGGEYNYHFPQPIRDCYSDVFAKMEARCFRPCSKIKYKFMFKGLIPDSARMSIAMAMQESRFNELFLLTEVPSVGWEVKYDRGKGVFRRLGENVRDALANIEIDPIIVGYAHDTMWVIDKFDTTKLEDYVLNEFARLELEAGS